MQLAKRRTMHCSLKCLLTSPILSQQHWLLLGNVMVWFEPIRGSDLLYLYLEGSVRRSGDSDCHHTSQPEFRRLGATPSGSSGGVTAQSKLKVSPERR